MNSIIQIFSENRGYARMSQIKDAGIHTRTVAHLLSEGVIEKIKAGLYKLRDFHWDENSSFSDVCMAENKAVICLISAASYYELILNNPTTVSIAVPQNTDKVQINTPPVKVYYFSQKYYSSGIEEVKNQNSSFRIYNREKTVVDLFRFRNQLGEEPAIAALKEFFKQDGRKKIPELMRYAREGRVVKIIEPIIKGIL